MSFEEHVATLHILWVNPIPFYAYTIAYLSIHPQMEIGSFPPLACEAAAMKSLASFCVSMCFSMPFG